MIDPPLMKREKVEHILRAAGNITGNKKFVLVGSAAIVAWREVVPPDLAMSRDVDLFAFDSRDVEEISNTLDGTIGQASPFDQQFGYYCDGVGPETAIMPADWRARAIEFNSPNTGGVLAIVPSPEDIALSKVYAWRPKDIDWLRAATKHLVIDLAVMREHLVQMPDEGVGREVLAHRIDSLSSSLID